MTNALGAITTAAAMVLTCAGGCGGVTSTTGDGGAPATMGDGGVTEGGSGSEGGILSCTPGVFVFCRCADRSEGTKQCQPDGRSFAACSNSTPGCGG